MLQKKCIVPSCKSLSTTHPEKIFLSVPKDKERRQKWFEITALDLNLKKGSHSLYCCEDHFNVSVSCM